MDLHRVHFCWYPFPNMCVCEGGDEGGGGRGGGGGMAMTHIISE